MCNGCSLFDFIHRHTNHLHEPVTWPALQRLLYWSAALAVWGLIFLVVFFAVFARGLPDTSSLYQVDRQPSITYLDRNGALIATRGTQMAPPAS